MHPAFATTAPLKVNAPRTSVSPTGPGAVMSAGVQSTLVSLPVSPFAARCRLLIFDKELDKTQRVKIATPDVLGGMKSEKHLQLNTLGKVPLLLLGDDTTALFESGVIFEYLNELYAKVGRSYQPEDPVVRARTRLIASILDQYIVPHNAWMYRRMEGDRAAGVKKMIPGWDALESAIHSVGPYVGGNAIGHGDSALWTIMPFYDFMLPAFFGWSVREGRPKLNKWLKHMEREPNATRVYDEVWDALALWWKGGRWDKLGMEALVDPTTLRPVWTADVANV